MDRLPNTCFVDVNCKNFETLVRLKLRTSTSDSQDEIEKRIKNAINLNSKCAHLDLEIFRTGSSDYEVRTKSVENIVGTILGDAGEPYTATKINDDMPKTNLAEPVVANRLCFKNDLLDREKVVFMKHLPQKVKCLNSFLLKNGQKAVATAGNFPKICLEHSVGGFESLLISSGLVSALVDEGLYGALTIQEGSSGGSWATALANHLDFEGENKKSAQEMLSEKIIPFLNNDWNFERKVFDTLMNGDAGYGNKQYEKYIETLLGENPPFWEYGAKLEQHNKPLPIINLAEVIGGKPKSFSPVEISPFYSIFEREKQKGVYWGVGTEHFGQEFDRGKPVSGKEPVTTAELEVASGNFISLPIKDFGHVADKLAIIKDQSLFEPVEYPNFRKGMENETDDVLKFTDYYGISRIALLPAIRRGVEIFIVTDLMKDEQYDEEKMNLRRSVNGLGPNIKHPIPESFLKGCGKEPAWKSKTFYKGENSENASVFYLNPVFLYGYQRKELTFHKFTNEQVDDLMNKGRNAFQGIKMKLAEEIVRRINNKQSN